VNFKGREKRGSKMEQMGRKNNEMVSIKVWDAPTRLLHWTNALLVLALLLLAVGFEVGEDFGVSESLEEGMEYAHAYIGHILVVTVFLRVVWAFVGNEYARWSDIIPYRAKDWSSIWGNIRWMLGGLRGKPPVSIGHNPLASLFYIAVFFVIVGQLVTGVYMAGEEFEMIPGSLLITSGTSEALMEAMEEFHEFGFGFIIFFVAAHMAGLAVHMIGEKKNLVRSMITGRKTFKKDELQ